LGEILVSAPVRDLTPEAGVRFQQKSPMFEEGSAIELLHLVQRGSAARVASA
jgi:hypothetical protein